MAVSCCRAWVLWLHPRAPTGEGSLEDVWVRTASRAGVGGARDHRVPLIDRGKGRITYAPVHERRIIRRSSFARAANPLTFPTDLLQSDLAVAALWAANTIQSRKARTAGFSARSSFTTSS
jgi:hypothetical protein